jgi:hypothetical protein
VPTDNVEDRQQEGLPEQPFQITALGSIVPVVEAVMTAPEITVMAMPKSMTGETVPVEPVTVETAASVTDKRNGAVTSCI